MIVGVNHIGVTTGNLDRLLAFYVAGLGFELLDRDDQWGNNPLTDRITGLSGVAGRKAFLRAGNLFVEIFEFTSPKPHQRSTERRGVNVPGYTHIALQVVDIEAELMRLGAEGLSFDWPTKGQELPARVIYGRDPDGNLIEIFELSADSPFDLSNARLARRGSSTW